MRILTKEDVEGLSGYTYTINSIYKVTASMVEELLCVNIDHYETVLIFDIVEGLYCFFYCAEDICDLLPKDIIHKEVLVDTYSNEDFVCELTRSDATLTKLTVKENLLVEHVVELSPAELITLLV